MTTTSTDTIRIETASGASRCRNFNVRGHQCGNQTRRVVVVERAGRPDLRVVDCGKHGR